MVVILNFNTKAPDKVFHGLTGLIPVSGGVSGGWTSPRQPAHPFSDDTTQVSVYECFPRGNGA